MNPPATLRKRGDSLFIALVLLCWAWMNLLAALTFEPWCDVAQPWMIVRQLSLPEIFTQLKYEGHPCLWFMLLLPLAKTGLPFVSIIALSFVLVLAGLWLFLRLAPLTRLQKLIVVFSAAGMYYLPVVARSYSLVPLLMMLLFYAYPRRYEKPVVYAAVLFLLCQVNILLCGFIGMLMLQWGVGAASLWVRKQPRNRTALLIALVILLIAPVFLYWQLSGSLATNRNVVFTLGTDFSAIRHKILHALTMGGWYLTTIHLYDYGNTVWWLILAPLGLSLGAMGVLWLIRAPRSAAVMLASFLWQLFIHSFIYGEHMHHMLIFLWSLLFCVMLANGELKARKARPPRPIDGRLSRALTLFMLVICLLSYTQVYPLMRDQVALDGINSEGAAAAEYIAGELPQDAVVLITNEDTATPVAAYLPEGKLYNPIRQNNHLFSLHDSYTDNWCTIGDLDAAVAALRAGGTAGALYLLADPRAEAAAQAMSGRSVAKLEEVRRFTTDFASVYEQYILYRIIEPQP